jgi:hypothetical protein
VPKYLLERSGTAIMSGDFVDENNVHATHETQLITRTQLAQQLYLVFSTSRWLSGKSQIADMQLQIPPVTAGFWGPMTDVAAKRFGNPFRLPYVLRRHPTRERDLP